MFCLNSKKEEKKEEKKIEKFENVTDYLPYLMVGLIVFLITFFCIYYFNKVSPIQNTKTSTAIAKLSSQNTQSSLPLLNPQTTKSLPVKNTKYLPISNIKYFGPDDIISPLLTSSSENRF